MNRDQFFLLNKSVFITLSDLSVLKSDIQDVITLGSVGLISHTQKVKYFRKIKDIDTIADEKYTNEIDKKLRNMGYDKSTFIDNKIPLSKVLKRYSETKYIRYQGPSGVDIEILFTPFLRKDNRIHIELFPKVKLSFPETEIVMNPLGDQSIKTITSNLMLEMYQLANATIGRIHRRDSEKRFEDQVALNRCIVKGFEKQNLLNVHIGSLKIR